MKKTLLTLAVVSALCSTSAMAADQYLTSFEGGDYTDTLTNDDYLQAKGDGDTAANVVIAAEATEGTHALEVVFGDNAPAQIWNWNDKTWNWESFDTLSLDIVSIASESIDVTVKITDSEVQSNGWGAGYGLEQTFTVEPGSNIVKMDLTATGEEHFKLDNILIVQVLLPEGSTHVGETVYIDNLYVDDSGDSATGGDVTDPDGGDNGGDVTDPDGGDNGGDVTDPDGGDNGGDGTDSGTDGGGTDYDVKRSGGSLGGLGLLLMGGLVFLRRKFK